MYALGSPGELWGLRVSVTVKGSFSKEKQSEVSHGPQSLLSMQGLTCSVSGVSRS